MKQQPQTPTWVRRLADLYSSGVSHAFILNFNVHDYIFTPGTDLTKYLQQIFPSKELFVIYDRMGFSFPTQAMRDAFMKECGLLQTTSAGSASPALASLVTTQQEDELPKETSEALTLINNVLRTGSKVAVIVRDAHMVWPEKGLDVMSDEERTATLMAMRWGTDIAEIGDAGNVVFLMTPVLSDLSSHLRGTSSRYEGINLPLPNLQEREIFVALLKKASRPKEMTWTITLEKFAQITSGLNLSQLEQVWLKAQEEGSLTQALVTTSANLWKWELRSEEDIVGDISSGLLPDYDERLEAIQSWKKSSTPAYTWHVTPAEFARLSGGLRLIDLEDIALRARQTGGLTPALIQERKEAIVSNEYADVIELVDPTFGFERVGELEHIKTFMREEVLSPIRKGDTLNVPKGVLFVGPPGTGKSLIAQALAKELGFNMLNLNFARIYGQYVGNTERNLEKALGVIRSLTPTIVFIDEIDQAVSRNSTGSAGVESRVFKRLLEFMADPNIQGQVIFLAATNRPDLIDSALMRPGRFDIRLPFFPPENDGREAILEIEMNLRGVQVTSIPEAVLKATDGWTGAELAGLARKAATIYRKGQTSAGAALEQAGQRLLPSTDEIEFFIKLALLSVNDLDLIPEKYLELAKSRSKWETQVSQEAERRDQKRERSRGERAM